MVFESVAEFIECCCLCRGKRWERRLMWTWRRVETADTFFYNAEYPFIYEGPQHSRWDSGNFHKFVSAHICKCLLMPHPAWHIKICDKRFLLLARTRGQIEKFMEPIVVITVDCKLDKCGFLRFIPFHNFLVDFHDSGFHQRVHDSCTVFKTCGVLDVGYLQAFFFMQCLNHVCLSFCKMVSLWRFEIFVKAHVCLTLWL